MLTLTFRRPMPGWQKRATAGQPFLDVSPRIKVSGGVEVHGLRLLFAGTIAEIATCDPRLGMWRWGGEDWTSFLLQDETLEDDPASVAVEEGAILPE